MIFAIHLGDSPESPTRGTIDAPDHFTAAREASRQFFATEAYPERVTGWGGHSGIFRTRPETGTPETFYVRKA